MNTLPEEHIFQKEYDKNCGLCCLAMVYKLRKKNISLKKIFKDFHTEQDGEPTYPAQLARHLLKNGLETKIITSNTYIMPPSWAKDEKIALIENLKERVIFNTKEEWHTAALHTLFYLQEGGTIELKPYYIEDVKQILDKGSQLIFCVDDVWLRGHRLAVQGKIAKIDNIRETTSGHFIIVTGYEDDNFFVLDPYPMEFNKKCGSYSLDAKTLLASSLTWAATLVEVLK